VNGESKRNVNFRPEPWLIDGMLAVDRFAAETIYTDVESSFNNQKRPATAARTTTIVTGSQCSKMKVRNIFTIHKTKSPPSTAAKIV
jgi:hypothetical protein